MLCSMFNHVIENKYTFLKSRNNFVGSLTPFSSELIYLNFHTLEVVSRYRDPQLQVAENYSYLFNLRPNICKF